MGTSCLAVAIAELAGAGDFTAAEAGPRARPVLAANGGAMCLAELQLRARVSPMLPVRGVTHPAGLLDADGG